MLLLFTSKGSRKHHKDVDTFSKEIYCEFHDNVIVSKKYFIGGLKVWSGYRLKKAIKTVLQPKSASKGFKSSEVIESTASTALTFSILKIL